MGLREQQQGLRAHGHVDAEAWQKQQGGARPCTVLWRGGGTCSRCSLSSPAAIAARHGSTINWPAAALLKIGRLSLGSRPQTLPPQPKITGVSHGIDLACRKLASPGDVIAVERPTYFLLQGIVDQVGACQRGGAENRA